MGAGGDGLEQTRVLVVDDESGVRDLLARWLTHNGYVVTTADSAEAALELMAQRAPDLVVTDLLMPGMNGGQLMETIMERHPGVPTIIITGNPQVEAAVELIKGGAADYISKPFDLKDIRSKVKQVIAEAHRRRRDAYVGTVFGMDLKKIGDYEVDGVLGEGANGIVFRARRPGESAPGNWVVKALKLPGERNGEARQAALLRFRNEGRIGKLIEDERVVSIVDWGIVGDGAIPYLVMPYLPGKPLAQLIAAGPCSREFSIGVLGQVAEALVAVHDAGVIHRDLKPGNIMIGDNGRATLMDFSIARVPGSDLTRADMILGSPAYIAPEVFFGSDIDFRADLFSLGVLGYELLTGARPFVGDTLARFSQSIPTDRPVRPTSLNPGIGTALEAILAALLKKRPEDRPEGAREVAAALRNLDASILGAGDDADDWTEPG